MREKTIGSKFGQERIDKKVIARCFVAQQSWYKNKARQARNSTGTLVFPFYDYHNVENLIGGLQKCVS